MSTSDRTHDPLGLGERGEKPPTRYDSEGISLPERGSGYVTPGPPPDAFEPEKLTIPAEAVAYLLNVAVQSQVGNAWWNGFVTAHGVPSWVASGRWAFQVGESGVVRTERTNGAAGAAGRG
jgi:hypothetical protein